MWKSYKFITKTFAITADLYYCQVWYHENLNSWCLFNNAWLFLYKQNSLILKSYFITQLHWWLVCKLFSFFKWMQGIIIDIIMASKLSMRFLETYEIFQLGKGLYKQIFDMLATSETSKNMIYVKYYRFVKLSYKNI